MVEEALRLFQARCSAGSLGRARSRLPLGPTTAPAPRRTGAMRLHRRAGVVFAALAAALAGVARGQVCEVTNNLVRPQ